MENSEFVLGDWLGVDFPVMAKPAQNDDGKNSAVEARLSILEERSKWHHNIGWGVAGFLGTALVVIVTWWIPRELASLQDSIKADTSSQLEPVKIEMAGIKALLQLKETKSVSEAIRLGVDFSEPKLAIEAVKAIAQQAKAESIATEPSVLAKANEQVKESAKGSPALLDAAWPARLALADYRSSLPLQPVTQGNPRPSMLFNGLTIDGGSANGSRQKLDGIHWKNYSFINVEIEYDGGPMELENVKFINCTFKMNYNMRASDFEDALLAQNPVTGSFS